MPALLTVRAIPAGALIEEQRVVGANRHDQQHANEMKDLS